MAKPEFYNEDDKITFNLVDKKTVARLQRDGEIQVPKKRVDVPKDKQWNKKQMASKLLQGIQNGDNINTIAKSLTEVIGNNAVSAIRNARTMFTSAECHGRIDSYHNLDAMGIVQKKVWIATPDDRTRESHLEIDGEEVDIDEEFSNGCQFPGDGNGPPEEVWNCRCSIRNHIIGKRNADGSVSELSARDDTMHNRQIEEEKARRENQEGNGSQGKGKEKDARSVLGLEVPQRPKQADYGGYTDEYVEARTAYREAREEYQKQLEDAVDASLDRTAFENKEQVIEWCKEQNINIDDSRVLDEVDIRTFNDVKPALEEMFERFPEAKEYALELDDGTMFNVTFNLGIDQNCLMSASRGLNFCLSDFEDYSNALRYGLDAMANGHLCMGDGTFETLVRHEYGHRIQDFLQTSLRNQYHQNLTDWRLGFDNFDDMKKAMNDYLEKRNEMDKELNALRNLAGASEYSNTNDLELFAEGFAEYASGGQTEFGIEFGKYLEKWWDICT